MLPSFQTRVSAGPTASPSHLEKGYGHLGPNHHRTFSLEADIRLWPQQAWRQCLIAGMGTRDKLVED